MLFTWGLWLTMLSVLKNLGEEIMRISDVWGVPFQRMCDTISIGTLLGTLLGWLPHIATALTVVWMVIRIWETETIQKFFKKRPDAE